MSINIPPKFDVQGRKQLWFAERDRGVIDDVVNGMLTALLVMGVLYLLFTAAGGL